MIIPTFKEAPNVAPLLAKLEAALQGVVWQAIFVDDNSPDGTAAVVKAIAATDPRVICLHRIGRRGLAGAVIEGAMASAAPFVAVIDGDMQHDETVLPRMLKALQADRADLAVGSRYTEEAEGRVAGLSARRESGSRFATWLGQRVLRLDLSDPMSGFFMIRRELVEKAAPRLATDGFKVLFDLASVLDPPPRVVEFAYEFRSREHGESKLDGRVVAHYLSLLGSKLSRDVLSPRALLFGLVGLSGVAVNVAVAYAVRGMTGPDTAQLIGAVVAMTSNYLINNAVTYRDKRKRGFGLLAGYLRFGLLCSIGFAANVAVASLVFQVIPEPWVGVVAGAGVGAAWNYVTTSLAVW